MNQWNVLRAALEGAGSFKIFSWIVVLLGALTFIFYIVWFVWSVIISNKPDLYFKKVDIYYIEKDIDKYSIGLVMEIVNKDVNKIYIVTGAEYFGGFSLVGNGSAILQSITFFNGKTAVTGKYSLQPGSPILIKLEVPQFFAMRIVDGQGPILEYNGHWNLHLENKTIEVEPESMFFKGPISNRGWDAL